MQQICTKTCFTKIYQILTPFNACLEWNQIIQPLDLELGRDYYPICWSQYLFNFRQVLVRRVAGNNFSINV